MTQEASSCFREEAAEKWFSAQNFEAPVSSNIGAANLPFQRWFRFKEAYSPAFVTNAVAACDYPVRHLLDPFGGSGTTALSARMQGLDSTSIEVNPFMADLIRVKVTPISPATFASSCRRLIDVTRVGEADYQPIEGAPATLVEPGVKGRYVYAREIYGALRALNRQFEILSEPEARLARVLLGSILVDCSNVRINGKGRRYRKNWEARQITRVDVFERFEAAVTQAVEDLTGFFDNYSCSQHRVYTDDARVRLKKVQSADLVVFSPPYPNSFDYTDVYNLELWMLGYFQSREDNKNLRAQTLRSHVQIKWPEVETLQLTPKLVAVKEALNDRRDDLWNHNIPEMVIGYFADLQKVLISLNRIVPVGGNVVAAVGDSQYGGVRIDVAGILAEIGLRCGYDIGTVAEIRSRRASAQHGGGLDLSETAVWLKRREGRATK